VRSSAKLVLVESGPIGGTYRHASPPQDHRRSSGTHHFRLTLGVQSMRMRTVTLHVSVAEKMEEKNELIEY
jgi:hypothetical protein